MSAMLKATLRKIGCYSYCTTRQQQRAIGSHVAANKPPLFCVFTRRKLSDLIEADMQNLRVAQLKAIVQMSQTRQAAIALQAQKQNTIHNKHVDIGLAPARPQHTSSRLASSWPARVHSFTPRNLTRLAIPPCHCNLVKLKLNLNTNA